jgi:hypothetical protein
MYLPPDYLSEQISACSRDSVIGIATGYGLNYREIGIRVPVASRIFSTSSRPALGPTQPPIHRIPGALPEGVKHLRRETDHASLISAEVKKNRDLYNHSPIRLHGAMLYYLSKGKVKLSL